MAGIYIHIPFCRKACSYCNFHFSTSLQYKAEMVEAICKELEAARDYLQGAPVETIYFGGGTPSLLSADEIKRISETIYKNYKADAVKEFTLEANPDDLSGAYLKTLRTTEIGRFSIGVQSFRDEDLRYMNRAHNAGQADYAIKAAQDAGFTNLSIDLIYGTPGLTDAAWKENLRQLSAYAIPHFSSYALTVEEGTALESQIRRHRTAPVDPAQAAGQFGLLQEFAAGAGYDAYEISNYGLPGMHAVHNTNYWKGVPYLGIGPSAHSFDGRSRRWNEAHNMHYLQAVLKNGVAPSESETLTETQQLNEYLMTSLRTMWGTDLNRIDAQWSGRRGPLLEEAREALERGWLRIEEHHLKLTETGKLFADRIASDLFFV